MRSMAWCEDFIRGDPAGAGNVFGYDSYKLNLPGIKEYDPAMPKGYKWRSSTSHLSPNFEIYINNCWICAYTLRECIKAARRIASRCNYLGIQDAPRKHRFPPQVPGVWSGGKSISTENSLYTSTTQAKWDKGKRILVSVQEEAKANRGILKRKSMEQGQGFLIH